MHFTQLDIELLPSIAVLAELALFFLGLEDNLDGIIMSDLDDSIEAAIRHHYNLSEDDILTSVHQDIYNQVLYISCLVTQALRSFFTFHKLAVIDKTCVYKAIECHNGLLWLALRDVNELQDYSRDIQVWEQTISF